MKRSNLKYPQSFIRTITLLLLVVLLSLACKTESPPTSEALIEGFVIDGRSDDWADQEKDAGDEVGDNLEGSPDLTQGYTVFKDGMLYFFVNLEDLENPYVQYDIYVWHENIKYVFSWKPGQEKVFVRTQPENKDVGELPNSEFALQDGLEGRIDPNDLELEEKIFLFKINVIVSEGDEWKNGDQWKPYLEFLAESEPVSAGIEQLTENVPEDICQAFIIDGVSDDWVDQTKDPGDEVGDNIEGFIDFNQGYTIFKDNALYFMIEVAEPESPYEQFDIYVWNEGQKYRFPWKPGQEKITVLTQPGMELVGELSNSEFAFKDGVEGCIYPGDLGIEGHIDLFKINAIADSQNADQWKPYIESMN